MSISRTENMPWCQASAGSHEKNITLQLTVYIAMTGSKRGLSFGYSALALAGCKSGHSVRMWKRVPGEGSRDQLGREQVPELSPDQCLESQHE